MTRLLRHLEKKKIPVMSVSFLAKITFDDAMDQLSGRTPITFEVADVLRSLGIPAQIISGRKK